MPKYFDYIFQPKYYMKQFFAMTPRHHRFRNILWKKKNYKHFTAEMKLALTKPTLRCLECGCKYNFSVVQNCPRCQSDKSSLLENDSFFSDPIVLVAVGFMSIIWLILSRIFGLHFHG